MPSLNLHKVPNSVKYSRVKVFSSLSLEKSRSSGTLPLTYTFRQYILQTGSKWARASDICKINLFSTKYLTPEWKNWTQKGGRECRARNDKPSPLPINVRINAHPTRTNLLLAALLTWMVEKNRFDGRKKDRSLLTNFVLLRTSSSRLGFKSGPCKSSRIVSQFHLV